MDDNLDEYSVVVSRIRQQMMVRNPEYKDGDFDICECGDYRHQHETDIGKCKICSWNNPVLESQPCQEFSKARSLELLS